MKPQTLPQQAAEIVAFSDDHTKLRAKRLSETQLARLTAANMRGLGKYAYELITNSDMLDAIAGKAIIALETTDAEQRKELLMAIGEMVLQGATEESLKAIDDCIDDAITNLAINRQFHDELEHAYRREHGDPMKRAIYNHPEL